MKKSIASTDAKSSLTTHCSILVFAFTGCAANTDPFGIGMVTNESNGEICKLGMFCCTCGLKKPQVLCVGASQFLCLAQVQSYPFNKDYVAEPLCAYCFSQCLPEMGCFNPFPECAALDKIKEHTTPASEVMYRQ